MADVRKSVGDKIRKLREEVRVEAVRARSAGDPNEANDIERELGRAGVTRTPEELPTQDTTDRQGNTNAGNVQPGEFTPSTDVTRGVYRIGPAQRPNITHDAGFSNFPRQSPTWRDRVALIRWYGMLEGGEALRPDLSDALPAYRHFLEGNGRERTFSYQRYVNNDDSGRITYRNLILEAQNAAIELWQAHNQNSFSFTGPAIPAGGGALSMQFPYPATENWQKAIGAHIVWLSGDVTVMNPTDPAPSFQMTLTIHAEDQYNFNPGASDITTGISDNDNGRFVIVGWAHGYRHTSEMRVTFSWRGFDLGVSSLGGSPVRRRQRQPQDNRRARNRL